MNSPDFKTAAIAAALLLSVLAGGCRRSAPAEPFREDLPHLTVNDDNREAYGLLRTLRSLYSASTTQADLLYFARAAHALVEDSETYQGDYGRARADMEEFAEQLDAGNTHEMSVAASILNMFARIDYWYAYDKLIREYPLYADEFEARSHLERVMGAYREEVNDLEEFHYQMEYADGLSADTESSRAELARLNAEKELLRGHVVNVAGADTVRTQADFDAIFRYYHSDSDPDFRHPMWDEIRPALHRWQAVREQIAAAVPDTTAALYRRVTEAETADYYHGVKNMHSIFLVPAF